jgi:hypothetical protein
VGGDQINRPIIVFRPQSVAVAVSGVSVQLNSHLPVTFSTSSSSSTRVRFVYGKTNAVCPSSSSVSVTHAGNSGRVRLGSRSQVSASRRKSLVRLVDRCRRRPGFQCFGNCPIPVADQVVGGLQLLRPRSTSDWWTGAPSPPRQLPAAQSQFDFCPDQSRPRFQLKCFGPGENFSLPLMVDAVSTSRGSITGPVGLSSGAVHDIGELLPGHR